MSTYFVTYTLKDSTDYTNVINITDSAWATYDIDKNLLEWMKGNI